jgi:hypothetical protein
MTKIGFFKRIGRPIPMGNKMVRTGDIIKIDYNFMMNQGVDGWLYIPPEKLKNVQGALKTPSKEPRETQSPYTIPTLPTKFEMDVIQVDEINSLNDITRMYESIENKGKEEIIESRPEKSVVVNIDKLKELKLLDNKQWISVTKAQLFAWLDEANVDYSHVQKTKWDLIKFIKGIIKDL